MSNNGDGIGPLTNQSSEEVSDDHNNDENLPPCQIIQGINGYILVSFLVMIMTFLLLIMFIYALLVVMIFGCSFGCLKVSTMHDGVNLWNQRHKKIHHKKF